MKPHEAFARTMTLLSDRPGLRIVAVAGPGEPFANEETLHTISMIKAERPDLKFCLSTNGVLLEENISDIVEIGFETVTVTISTVKAETAAVIYEWAEIDGSMMRGISMGEEIIKRQLRGISKAAKSGIHIKCNTILIPSLNATQMKDISKHLSLAGTSIQNIVPLVPFAEMSHLQAPTKRELTLARQAASEHCRQFTHCRQCRSDVVGLPGHDTVL
jgi:nitrogen fixation protein NifB